MCAYSVDLRERVLNAVARGMPRLQVVRTFDVSLATVKRWLARQRIGADLTPVSPTGRQRTILPPQHAALWAQLEANRDAPLATHVRLWNEAYATMVSVSTLRRAIQRLGWTYKKRRWEPPNAPSSPDKRIGTG
jgi:transposase